MGIKRIYDFELCENLEELKRCLRHINEDGLILGPVTQDCEGSYTVFFYRMVCYG